MRTAVFFCMVVASVLLENANAHHSLSSTHLTTGYHSSPTGTTVVRTYAPSSTVQRTDAMASIPTPYVVRTTYGQPQQEAEKVRLDIYYETDCPDSMRFITNQLYPLTTEMEDVLDIHLIPYGKAVESYNPLTHRYDFLCQHGESECYGNTVQSCVMSLYPEMKDYFNFINCMEMYPRPSRNGHKCARRLSLDWDKIEKCALGEEGNRLLHENAQLTEGLNPNLYFVPWIVVNKNFSPKNQRMALRNLQYVVCNSYKGNHPKCQR